MYTASSCTSCSTEQYKNKKPNELNAKNIPNLYPIYSLLVNLRSYYVQSNLGQSKINNKN